MLTFKMYSCYTFQKVISDHVLYYFFLVLIFILSSFLGPVFLVFAVFLSAPFCCLKVEFHICLNVMVKRTV